MKRVNLSRGILMILGILFAIVLVAAYFITPELMASSIENQEKNGNKNASMVLKERLIQFFPGSEEARWEAYSLADSVLQGEGRVMIGPDFTSGGGGQGISVTAEEVIVYLRRVAEAQKEAAWKYNSYEKIAQIYRMQGDYKEAEENFLKATEGFEKENKGFRAAEINGSLIELYLETGEAEKALALTEQSIKKYADQFSDKFLSQKGDAYFLLGDYGKAEQFYRDALEQAKKDWENFRKNFNDKESNINVTLENQPVYRHSKNGLERIKSLQTEGKTERGKVKGEIFSGDVPMSNVIVYLINEAERDGRISSFEGIESGQSVKTDARGRFEFNGVIPGKYIVVLGIIPKDLEGIGRFKGLEAFSVYQEKTVELKYVFQPRVKISEPAGQQTFHSGQELKIVWEEVPQASSYNLHITLKLKNGYVSRVYAQNLKGYSYLFNPRGLALREMNFVARGDSYVLAPSAILGSFYPGAEIYFVVEALDGQGKSISDSEGYTLQYNGNYPSILVKEEGNTVGTTGDKLVLEMNYQDAVQAYLKELEANPSDPDTLLSLARLYSYGWAEGTSDLKKAVNYYGKLLQNTRDKFIVEEAAVTNVQAGNDALALELFEEIEGEFEKNSYWYHLMGDLYFRTGQTEKALLYYLKFLSGQKEFIDLGPVIAMLYLDDVNGAIGLLQEKEYSQRLRYNGDGQAERPGDIERLVSHLKKYDQGMKSILSKEEFHKYLVEIVNIKGDNRLEKVKEFQTKIQALGENDVLVAVLNELVRDRL